MAVAGVDVASVTQVDVPTTAARVLGAPVAVAAPLGAGAGVDGASAHPIDGVGGGGAGAAPGVRRGRRRRGRVARWCGARTRLAHGPVGPALGGVAAARVESDGGQVSASVNGIAADPDPEQLVEVDYQRRLRLHQERLEYSQPRADSRMSTLVGHDVVGDAPSYRLHLNLADDTCGYARAITTCAQHRCAARADARQRRAARGCKPPDRQ